MKGDFAKILGLLPLLYRIKGALQVKAKRRLGCLGIVLVIVVFACGVPWFVARHLDDFEDDFLNAVYAGESSKVETMLKAGENPNKRDAYGNNPMTLAAYAGHSGVLKLLLDRGGAINSRDNTAMTPLHCAAYHDRLSAAQLLLERGADIDAKNEYGFTPLSEAVGKGFPDMTALLLRAGPSVETRDGGGWQPLHQVLRSNGLTPDTRMQIVVLLLNHGADPNTENPGGWEEDSKHDSTVSPFAFRRARRANRGNTPLSIAQSNGDNKIAELLRKYGARK